MVPNRLRPEPAYLACLLGQVYDDCRGGIAEVRPADQPERALNTVASEGYCQRPPHSFSGRKRCQEHWKPKINVRNRSGDFFHAISAGRKSDSESTEGQPHSSAHRERWSGKGSVPLGMRNEHGCPRVASPWISMSCFDITTASF